MDSPWVFMERALGVDGQPLGVYRQPLGVYRQPLGVYGQPLGVCRQPLGVYGQPLGVYGQPLGVWTLIAYDHIAGLCTYAIAIKVGWWVASAASAASVVANAHLLQ